MIATAGSRVKVRLYRSAMDRHAGNEEQAVDVMAHVISAGPPGVAAAWARTEEEPGRWILIRKPRCEQRNKYEAFEGDPGVA